MRLALCFLLSLAFLVSSCCKEAIPPNEAIFSFEQINKRNLLPHTLPTTFNIATEEQTKRIALYNEDIDDIVFRAIGVKDATSDNTKLWIQILNPDIKVFADTQLDSIFNDTTSPGPPPLIERHNRSQGLNFDRMDTALLALPFLPSQFDTYRPRLLDLSVATVHVRFDEFVITNNTRFNIERGALKWKQQGYMGIKNIKTGDVFFIELMDRYTIKSIQVRKD